MVLQFPAMKRLLFLFLLIPFLAAQTTTEVAITAEHLTISCLRTNMFASSRSRQDEKLKQNPSPWPEESGEKTFAGGRTKILFVKDGVRVSEVNIEPGAVTPIHHHDGPHLAVAVTDLDLRSDVEGHGAQSEKMRAGDVAWLPGNLTHTVTNQSKNPARLVTVEF